MDADTMFFLIQLAILLAVIFFVIKFVIVVFLHYLYSRIFSIVCGVAGIVISIVCMFFESWTAWLLFPLFWFQYMMFIGPAAFDEYWDGTVTITFYLDKDEYEVKDNIVKMFAVHTAISLIVGVPFIFLWAAELPILRFIPFAVVLLITLIGFIRQIIDNFAG